MTATAEQATVSIDPSAVPDGYVAIIGQFRAFPASRIVDVEGHLSGGTTIWLEGGKPVRVAADINEVLLTIGDAQTRTSSEAHAMLVKPRPIEVDGIAVIAPTEALLEASKETAEQYGGAVGHPDYTCGARPSVKILTRMKRAGITTTTTCVLRRHHGSGRTPCLTVVTHDHTPFDGHPVTTYLVDENHA